MASPPRFIEGLQRRLIALLRASERYTKTDMVYLFRGGFLLTGSDAILALVSLGVSVLVAAYVPKETYGIYRYIISVANIVVVLSLTGMNSAITRAVALGREGVFKKSLPLQGKFALLQFACTAAVAGYYFYQGNQAYGYAFIAVSLLAPAAGVFNSYVAFLTGRKEFGRLSWWKIEAGLINAAAMAAVIIAQPTFLGLTIAFFLSTLVMNLWFLLQTISIYKPNKLYEGEDLSYGKHLSLMNGISVAATQLDSILIYHLLGPVSLAVYSFAILIPERLRSLLGFLPNLALPKLAGKARGELRSTLRHRLLLITLGSAAIALLYFIAAPILFMVFFRQYAESVPYTELASFFVLAIGPAYLTTVLTAEGSHKALYIISIASPILKVILSVICILLFGIWGAIFARLLAGLFQGALSYALIGRGGSSPGENGQYTQERATISSV